jgi:hypothetical protein
MIPCIKNMLEELPDDMSRKSQTPADSHLFTVNENGTKLNEEQSIMFHHNTAKLFSFAKRHGQTYKQPSLS